MASFIRRTTREITRIVRQYRLAVIVESRGQLARLPVVVGKIARARLQFGIGPRHFSCFRLADRPPATWSDYITDNPAHKNRIRALSTPAGRRIADDKALFHVHCCRHDLATVPNLGLLSSSREARYEGIRTIATLDEWLAMLSSHDGDLFIKPLHGTFGEGALVAARDGTGYRCGSQSIDTMQLYSVLRERLADAGALLVQPRILNHSTIRRMTSPRGLSTVRAVTCLQRGTPRVLYTVLKVIVGGNSTDNYHLGMSGNLLAALDPVSGRIGKMRGSLRTDWPAIVDVAEHPDSGLALEGCELPFWQETISLVLRAQASLPDLPTAGWDVAITDDGPVLLETNTTYHCDILQIALGHSIGRDLYRSLALPYPGD